MFNPLTVLYRPIALNEALWLLLYGFAGVCILHYAVMAVVLIQARKCDFPQARNTAELD